MELFKLEPGLAIWTWISFGILFFILWKFVLPVIIGNIQKREDYIASAVDNSEKIETRLREIDEEREEILKRAGKEADDILHNARDNAEQLRQKLSREAEQEAENILARARKTADEEREAALRSLQKELADFICDASEKVVGMAFITDKERAWTRENVKTL